MNKIQTDISQHIDIYCRLDNDLSFTVTFTQNSLPYDVSSFIHEIEVLERDGDDLGIFALNDGFTISTNVVTFTKTDTQINAVGKGRYRLKWHITNDSGIRQTWFTGHFNIIDDYRSHTPSSNVNITVNPNTTNVDVEISVLNLTTAQLNAISQIPYASAPISLSTSANTDLLTAQGSNIALQIVSAVIEVETSGTAYTGGQFVLRYDGETEDLTQPTDFFDLTASGSQRTMLLEQADLKDNLKIVCVPVGVTGSGTTTYTVKLRYSLYSDASVSSLAGNAIIKSNGFIDYNNSSASIPITANTWTTITNNGAGAFTNKNYVPTGTTDLYNTSTNKFTFTQLALGDWLILRIDVILTTTSPNTEATFRFSLAEGSGGDYTLEFGRNSFKNSGVHPLTPIYFIYMGDANTRNFPASLQIRTDASASVVNNGIAIGITKR